MDLIRQRRGELMDRLGFGPRTTPSRIIGRWRTAQLRAYRAAGQQRPPLLIVPAPIKAAYIWDLAPEISVVRRCLAAGFPTYLIDWDKPGPEDEDLGLEDYSDRLILECLEAITAESGAAKIFLAGHSLGGTLAALFASLHPDRLLGLIELEGPIEFKAGMGPIETTVAAAPPADTMTAPLGNVPGSFLSAASWWVAPTTFGSEPLADWLASLLRPATTTTHLQVRRWTLDETPMPRRLFEDVLEQLYRESRFAEGTLALDHRPAQPRAVSAPILAVGDPRSRIIPWSSIEAYRDLTGSRDVELLEYEGDVGVMLQHLGVLVGENAHQLLWPRILDWMRRRSSFA